jgi:hypothetical protein
MRQKLLLPSLLFIALACPGAETASDRNSSFDPNIAIMADPAKLSETPFDAWTSDEHAAYEDIMGRWTQIGIFKKVLDY